MNKNKKNITKEKTTEELVKKLADESGNNIHIKVVKFLRDKGWAVEISPYYEDIIKHIFNLDDIQNWSFPKKHHYLEDCLVAKLFDSNDKKDQDNQIIKLFTRRLTKV